MSADLSTPGKGKLYTAAAAGLVLAAAGGFGIAKLTSPSAPAPATEASKPEAESDVVAMADTDIRTAGITVAPASAGELDSAIPASATVGATPDAEAVLTARAPGTVVRIFKRIGDSVRAGETLALVESRDASGIAADRAAANARVGLAQKQLAREKLLLSKGVSPRADYETAQANLAVAQADARRAGAAASAVRLSGDGRSVAIVSPITGRVTSAAANLGQSIAAETELFRVVDPKRMQITASLPPADAGRVQAGDRVELATNDGRVMEGRVRSATGVVDPNTRAATVVIDASAGGSLLVPGQLAQARIFASGGAAKNGVVVAQDAVQTLGDRSVVFVRTRAGFKAQPVQVGRRSGGLAAIVSGLAAGSQIATANAFLLKAEIEKNQGGEE
jgi:cobalt-zinc-cadmium efflux system membrane fusion protein